MKKLSEIGIEVDSEGNRWCFRGEIVLTPEQRRELVQRAFIAGADSVRGMQVDVWGRGERIYDNGHTNLHKCLDDYLKREGV